jgi:hypothetical protein
LTRGRSPAFRQGVPPGCEQAEEKSVNMKWHFEKNDFFQWCDESGVEVPPELIQEKPKPRNMEELVERELERLNSKEPDPMTKLLQEILFAKQSVEILAFRLENQRYKDRARLADDLSFTLDKVSEVWSLAGKLAAELEAHS